MPGEFFRIISYVLLAVVILIASQFIVWIFISEPPAEGAGRQMGIFISVAALWGLTRLAVYRAETSRGGWTPRRRDPETRRQQQRRCPSCGYDWRITPGSCSECGYGHQMSLQTLRQVIMRR